MAVICSVCILLIPIRIVNWAADDIVVPTMIWDMALNKMKAKNKVFESAGWLLLLEPK